MNPTNTYKISINDHNYTSWSICDAITHQPQNVSILPFECKLMHDDVFTIDYDDNDNNVNKINIVHSTARVGSSIPAILMLNGNKTFGREKGKGKLLYKCVPDDVRLPYFLVSYEMKHTGFSKVFDNMYVTICYDHWEYKHPNAKLDNVIGPVSVIHHFYEYQLYCKSLYCSIQQFQKKTKQSLETTNHESVFNDIEDRTQRTIITIDPVNSLDYDDGFGLVQKDEHTHVLSIYISNVAIWLDVLQLWSSFSRRISTIYLPDKKRPMIPTLLSDCLCSLQQGVKRIAFVMDMTIHKNEIVHIQFGNATIKVARNYTYEEKALLENVDYIHTLRICQQLAEKYRFVNRVSNSHDLVCYLMIAMNYYCARELQSHQNGVFRIMKPSNETIGISELPEEVQQFIQWNNNGTGQYIAFSDTLINHYDTDTDTNVMNTNVMNTNVMNTNVINTNNSIVNHTMLKLDVYVHITSPIRRLVDLLNIIAMQYQKQLFPLSEHCIQFYTQWVKELNYINLTMRKIRKLQCDCSLLDICIKDQPLMEKTYDGFVFDKVARNDKLFQYSVYLPSLKLSCMLTIMHDLSDYSKHLFKLYLFYDEERLKRKIRIQLIS